MASERVEHREADDSYSKSSAQRLGRFYLSTLFY